MTLCNLDKLIRVREIDSCKDIYFNGQSASANGGVCIGKEDENNIKLCPDVLSPVFDEGCYCGTTQWSEESFSDNRDAFMYWDYLEYLYDDPIEILESRYGIELSYQDYNYCCPSQGTFHINPQPSSYCRNTVVLPGCSVSDGREIGSTEYVLLDDNGETKCYYCASGTLEESEMSGCVQEGHIPYLLDFSVENACLWYMDNDAEEAAPRFCMREWATNKVVHVECNIDETGTELIPRKTYCSNSLIGIDCWQKPDGSYSCCDDNLGCVPNDDSSERVSLEIRCWPDYCRYVQGTRETNGNIEEYSFSLLCDEYGCRSTDQQEEQEEQKEKPLVNVKFA